MNQISKLILEHCPSGVPRVALGNFCFEINVRNKTEKVTEVRSVTNNRGLIVTSEYFENTRTSTDTSNYKVISKNMFVYNPSRINVGSIAWNQGDHDVIVSPMYIAFEIDTKQVLPAFLMYFLDSGEGKQQILEKCEVGARFRFPFTSLAKLTLNLPPLVVQQRIVDILDKFGELESELQKELEARKIQYAFYRSQILSFEEPSGIDVRWIPLGEVCEYRKERAKTSPTSYLYIGVEDLLQERRGIASSARYVDSVGHDVFMPGDVLIGNIRPYLKKVWLSDIEGRTNGDVLVVTPKSDAQYEIDSQYLYFLLSSDEFFVHCVKTSKGAKMPRGDKKAILRYEIPIPDISHQRRIVEILSKFETLTGDLELGIPAELAFRRKQFDFYHKALLAFNEIGVA